MKIGIARCCANCRHRSERNKSKIFCDLHKVDVPIRGYCSDYKQTISANILSAEKNLIKDLVAEETYLELKEWLKEKGLIG